MITIPTGDLVGILADVIPFAWPNDDIPQLNAVRVEWDGSALHALASDRFRIAWSTWEPGDVATDEEVQDDLFTEWGGADDPWRVTLRHSDVVELAKVFKLPPKVAHAPLTIDHEADRRRLTVKRARDTGHTAHTMAVEDLFTDEFPDLPAFLASADRATSRRSVQFNAKQLADFAKVRPRGPLAMSFAKASGPGVGAVLVSVGERFRGAIAPMREDAGGGGTLLHATAEQD